MPQSLPPARRFHDIGGIAHAFHTACQNEIRLATLNGLDGRNDSLHGRPAGTVDGKAGGFLWDARIIGCVAGNILLHRPEAAAEYDLVDPLGLNFRTGYDFSYDMLGQIQGGNRPQGATKISDGSSCCPGDHNLFHIPLPPSSFCIRFSKFQRSRKQNSGAQRIRLYLSPTGTNAMILLL